VKGAIVRRLGLVAAAIVLLAAEHAAAQEWATYTNRVDRFEVGCLLGFITLEGAAEKMFD